MAKPAAPGKVHLVSLGCPKNRVDSEILLGELRAAGHEIVPEADDAETVIVNTCGFIEEAKQESIDAILDAAGRKESAGVRKLLVAGCMANRYAPELEREIPEIDGFIGLDQLREASELVRLGSDAPAPAPAHLVFDHTAPRVLTTRGHAYLKVAEGCDNPCTFCAIPVWRGRFRSRTVESLVEEARRLERAGALELCLIAQDTTRYGEDLGLGRQGLTRLVEALLERTTVPWIRFLYAYPATLDRELLRLMAAEERFCSYLDIPLQHSHPGVLKAMRRGGSAASYLRLLEEARATVPEIALRSSFIVGFPGEGAAEFADLLAFVRSARFDHLGAFVFSREEDTPSAGLPGQVPRAVARRRYEELLETQRPISLASRQRLVGSRRPALVEGVCGETEHLLEGRLAGMAPEIDGRLLINDGRAQTPALVEVEITEAYADDLVARIVGPVGQPGIEPAAA